MAPMVRSPSSPSCLPTVRHMNGQVHHGQCILHGQPTNAKLANLTCSTMIANINNVVSHLHLSNFPVARLLQGEKTRTIMKKKKKTVLTSQVVQPFTTPLTIYTNQINRAKEATVQAPPWLGSISLFTSNVFHLSLEELQKSHHSATKS